MTRCRTCVRLPADFNYGDAAMWRLTWEPPGSQHERNFVASAARPPVPPSPPREPPAPAYVDLVIAAYAENVDFIEEFIERMPRSQVRLYCKGPHMNDTRCSRIANYGAESYGYLSHIVANYHLLAPITIFTLGSIVNPEWHFLKCKKADYLVSNLQTVADQESFPQFATVGWTSPNDYWQAGFDYGFTLGAYRASVRGGVEPLCRAPIQPLGQWYQQMISSDLSRTRSSGVAYNAIFAARREQIQQWPLSTWQRLKSDLERCPEGDPQELDHYMERTWKSMLDVYGRARSGRQPLYYSWDCPEEVIAISRAVSSDRGTEARDSCLENCGTALRPCRC